MNDRRRLLILSILIMTSVALVAVYISAYHFRAVGSGEIPDSLATTLAITETLVLIAAGGTLLVRASNPFMWRLEQSEARVRAILNTAADGILTIDEQGRLESVNLAAARMFGVSAQRVLGRAADELFALPCAEEDLLYPSSLGSRALALMLAGYEILGRRTCGTTFPLELSVSEVRYAERRTFAVIARDITDRRAAEEQIRDQMTLLAEVKETLEIKAAELAKTNRELDDFTYVASHDLKEPLRGISSYCQILLDDYADRIDADGKRRLESLVGLGKRLGQLIDDLLTYSRIGRVEREEKPTDLNVVLKDVLETLGPAIDDRRGNVRVIGQLPVATADPTMVGEVLRNLITNGLKFNDSEQPTVEIGSLDTEPATIFVRDNGIGIAEQHHEAVFTMFRRLHSRRKYEGTGAGLTLVRKIVEAHGGQVWLESQTDRGSTFYFTLAPGPQRAQAELATSAAG